MKKDNYRSKYNNAVHDTHHIKCYFCSESLSEVTELVFCYFVIHWSFYECCAIICKTMSVVMNPDMQSVCFE